MSPDKPTRAEIEAAILRLAQDCAPGRSIDPGEVARALAADWHGLLGPVRRAAVALAEAGRIEILRKGRPVDPAQAKGVIRLRRPGHLPSGASRADPESGATH